MKGNKSTCPPELQGFATTLMFHSASAYDFVRSVFLKSLPHPQTVRSWFRRHDFQPGILIPVLESLQKRHEEEVEKGKVLQYGLQADEMSIKKQIQLVGGNTFGYVDLGGGIKVDSVEAKSVLVFMIVTLNSNFKVPIAFYFIDSLDGEQRANLSLEVIRALYEYQIANVRSYTFDCPSFNITMAAKLGCGTAKSGEEALVFTHPNTNEQIVAIPDACHMLKLARNTLGDYDIEDGDGNTISFKYLKRLVDIQVEEGLHLATKIRRRHIKYCKEKMKVKTAAQTLSESCAVGLEFLEIDAHYDSFQGAQATATFCRNINNIFDILNSKRKFFVSSETKKCISEDNLESIKKKVDDYVRYLKSLKLKVIDSNDPSKSTSVPLFESTRYTGFWGFVKSLKGAVKLAEYLFQNTDMEFLLTYKLSQDHLETFFSCIRRRGGFNNNPTCRDFIAALVRLLTHAKVISPKSGNCLKQDNTTLIPVGLKSKNNIAQEENNFECSTSETADNFYDFSHSYEAPFNWTWNMYKENIVTYIAGSVVKTLKNNIKCTECYFSLESENEPCALQIRKCRGGLNTPSEDVIVICKIAERVLKMYPNVLKMKNNIQFLTIKVKELLPCWIFSDLDNTDGAFGLTSHSLLENHKNDLVNKILNQYYKIRLHHECTLLNEPVERIRNHFNRQIIWCNQ